jgi:hypothetical protein
MYKSILVISILSFILGACLPKNKETDFNEKCNKCATFYMFDTFNQSKSGSIIYQAFWNTKEDSSKPSIDLSYISTYLKFPYYFPKSNVAKIGVDSVFELNEQVKESKYCTNYSYKYNKTGNIIAFNISSPNKMYSATYFYDSLNHLNQIKESSLTNYFIEYKSIGDVCLIKEINSNNLNTRTLKVKFN